MLDIKFVILLLPQAILFKSAKKKNGMKVGFVTFDTAEQVKTAVEVHWRTYFGSFFKKCGICFDI